MVYALASVSSCLGSGLGWGHRAVLLCKANYSHGASVNLILGVALRWTSIPSIVRPINTCTRVKIALEILLSVHYWYWFMYVSHT